ncbi:MAG: hypothetical protein JNN27_14220 [Planctomycetes bacterium]|nr:hypothetical protein [Planctomycetota bacterium]
MSVSDLVISGPVANSVPIVMHMDAAFSGADHWVGGLSYAVAYGECQAIVGGGWSGNLGLNGTAAIDVTVSTSVTPNQPQSLAFTLSASAKAGGFYGGYPGTFATATAELRFPIGEPVFVLPPGYTADCPSLNIVNNHWLGPQQCDLPPLRYGTAKINSQGCAPRIGWSGSASASSAAPFLVTASNVLNNKLGLLFYGFAPANQPFQGGTKLVADPVRRTPVQSSGGNAAPDDCSGTYSVDMNTLIQSGVDPNLVANADVFCQYWSRDPASPSPTGLTDALRFSICP